MAIYQAGEFIGSLIFLLILFAVVRFLARMPQGLLKARRPAPSHPVPKSPTAIVTLIHGTFARGAPWTLPGSPLCEVLRSQLGEGALLRRFDWSGRNSFDARAKAAAALSADISKIRRDHPSIPHYLIGHSHGGSVAMGGTLAAGPDSVAGVVCLATPVLTTHERQFSPFVRTMIGFGFFVTLLLLASFLFPWMKLFDPKSPMTNREMGLMVVCAALAFGWYKAAHRVAERVCESLTYSRLDPERVAFVRSPFDEASGVIGLANVVSWLIGRLTSGSFELFASFRDLPPGRTRLGTALRFTGVTLAALALSMLWIWPPAMRLFGAAPWLDTIAAWALMLILLVGATGLLLTLLAPVLTVVHERRGVRWVFWPVYLYILLIGGFIFVPAIVVMSFAHAAAVGAELLLCSVLVEVTAEPCPPGNWTLYQLKPPPEGDLRHSSVYANENALAAVRTALAAIVNDAPVPLLNDEASATETAIASRT